jgi:hypothetical protein
MSTMAESQRKDLGIVLLSLEPLTQEEKRLPLRLIRVQFYADRPPGDTTWGPPTD